MKIVCFGDSLTACGGTSGRYSDILQQRFPDHHVVNRGKGGETLAEGWERFQEDVLDEHPDVVLFELGACDWWADERSPEACADDLDAYLTKLDEAGVKSIVLGVFGDYLDEAGNRRPKTYGTDERAVAYRELEAEIAERHGAPYIANIQERIIGDRCAWSDRNHPNEYGNRLVANCIEPELKRLLGTEPLPIRTAAPKTTLDFWREAVALRPDHCAVIDGERQLTYAAANEQVERLAAGLARLSGATRPKVAVYLPNCLEYYLLYWALVRLGGTIVPLNTWLSEENLASIFERVQPDLLVCESPRDRHLLAIAPAGLPVCMLHGESDHDFAALAATPERAAEVDVQPDDLAIVMHTSGTTAAPKGGMMRHRDLIFNVMAAINAHQFSPDDVHLLVNPMFHCTALYSSLPSAAYQKSTLVITADTHAEALLRLVERRRITTFLTIPTICQRLVSQPNLHAFDLSTLRILAYAGSMMPVSTIHQLQKNLPEVELHNFFGLTETISMTHVLTGEQAEERPDSIGRLLPYVEAIVVGEDGQRAAAGEVGELLFARENVIPGYYGRPGLLEESLVELEGRSWFVTGDLASIDEDGFFFIKGRKKDMIIVGGENVYAAEVEAILMSHDGVKEAAVTGVPATGIRSSLGELIHAFVVKGDAGLTERDLRRHCHQRLASFKIPTFITFVEELPRNPSGKVVKAELPV